ncbi:HYC_CC_PP family protein [Spongiimicrobium sp. 3-5]|uniref:HYC_CC_PP family protein n=1 Tax=Spongiimicrobium sp. 3-5 TaxID=3332596 RepID=UPI003981516A
MKGVFHKIASVAMALLLLASTTSWMVGKHYCMGHLVDIAFFTEADRCGMEADLTKDTLVEKMSCCDDEVIAIDGQDDLKLSFNDLSLDNSIFLAAFTFTFIDLFEGLAEHIVPHDTYPPPILVKNIQLLDQVFLI